MMHARLLPVLATTLMLTASTSALSDEPLDQVVADYKEAAAKLANAKTVEEWRASIADGTEELMAVDADIKVVPVDAGGVSAEWVIPLNANAQIVF